MVRPKQKTDEEILEVARQCFMEGGHGISTQTIADRVGLSQPALFKRFGTKDELFLAALAPPETFPALNWIETNPVPGPIKPQLKDLVTKIWDSLKWILPRVVILHTSNISPEKLFCRYQTPPPLKLLYATTTFVERAQRYGQLDSSLHPEATAQEIMGLLQGRAFFNLLMCANAAPDDDEYLQSAVNLLCKGILNTESNQ